MSLPGGAEGCCCPIAATSADELFLESSMSEGGVTLAILVCGCRRSMSDFNPSTFLSNLSSFASNDWCASSVCRSSDWTNLRGSSNGFAAGSDPPEVDGPGLDIVVRGSEVLEA